LWIDLELPEKLDTTQAYQLRIDSAFTTVDGHRPDSTLIQNIRPPNWLQLSALSGLVESTGALLHPIVLAHTENGPLYRSSGETFDFQGIQSGQYRFTIIDDRDGNGAWTTGSLTPWRAPEPVYHFPTPVEVRPGWSVEEHVLDIEQAAPVFPSETKTENESTEKEGGAPPSGQ
jgi:hypothetical protein